MSWFLNAVYVGMLSIFSPWILWRYLTQGKHRRGWKQKLFGAVSPRPISDQDECIWFHAVSVGEVNLLEPILKQLHVSRPGVKCVISTTTETGFDLARQKYPHQVFFCPFDFSWAIKRVIKRLRPQLLVLAELELWPNLIRISRESGIPVAIVNGRLSESSFNGYKKFQSLIGSTFKQLSLVCAQNQTYADRFRNLGCQADDVLVTGSVKFDGVETDRCNPRSLELCRIAGHRESAHVWVAGSTQLEEDLLAARVYQQIALANPNLRLILVPRHPNRVGTLVEKLTQWKIPTRLRSELRDQEIDTVPAATQRFECSTEDGNRSLDPILIVDVIGELGAWWGTADVAYVGGSFGKRGGQNMIEPAAFGIPVSFGPQTSNFKAVVDELIGNQAAVVVHNEASLRRFIERSIADTEWGRLLGQRAQEVVLSHVGASKRTVDGLGLLLDGTLVETQDREADPTAPNQAA